MNIKILCGILLCVTLLQAQERFFVYGKVLGADGLPLPSAQVSLRTLIDQQPISFVQAGVDGSFKLVVSGYSIALLTFTGAASDSFLLPLLLTTEQYTLNLTVRLPLVVGQSPGIAAGHAALQIQYGNTELGIVERLMVSMMEEKRRVQTVVATKSDSTRPDLFANGAAAKTDSTRSSVASIGTAAKFGVHTIESDSILSALSVKILAEQNRLHREAFLLRYMQVRTDAKVEGNPAIVKMVLGMVEPSSPLWSLVPELIRVSASTPKEYADYSRRVIARTHDPELKAFVERQQ